MAAWSFVLIGLIREQVMAEVTIDEAGNAIGRYSVTDEVDIRNIRAGVEQLIRIHEARGRDRRQRARARRLAPRADLDAFVADVTSQPIAPRGALFSAHQMGSCRMGTDRELGRRPARRAARHARGLDRRRERLPEPVGHQPDADDHGAGATDRTLIAAAG